MPTDLANLIRKCESLAKAGRIDEAETIMSYIEKVQKAQNEEDDWSEPADAENLEDGSR